MTDIVCDDILPKMRSAYGEERFANSASRGHTESFEMQNMTSSVCFVYSYVTWTHPRTGRVWTTTSPHRHTAP